MSDVINFDRLWAYGAKGLEYPNDTETSIGFDFLGKEYPTTHLHDVMFQDLDKKSRYLWRQIHHACARFGVTIEATDDETYTNGLGEAINKALLNQVRSSEQNTGIIQLATTAVVQNGTEYNMAVSPAQLKTELDRRLREYTSRAEFITNWRTLKTIATSGQLEDGEGMLGFTRISNVPRWIRDAYDESNVLKLTSPYEMNQIVIGGSQFKLQMQGDTKFSVNLNTGNIDLGTIDQTHVHNLGQVARDNNYYSLSNLPSLGTASSKNVEYFDIAGSAAAAASDKVVRDGITTSGFLNGDKNNGAYFRSTDGSIIGIARSDELANYKKLVTDTYVLRDGISIAGFMGGSDANSPYFRSLSGNVITLAKSLDLTNLKNSLGTASSKNVEYFDIAGAANAAKNEAISNSVVRDNSRRAGFISGNKYAPYIEFNGGDGTTEVIELARQAYLGEQLGKLGTLSTQNSDSVNITGGTIKVGSITSTNNGASYRLINGTDSTSYGSYWRMDPYAYHLCLTKAGDTTGSYRDDKGIPISVLLSDGTIKLNTATEIYGGLELYNGGGTPFIDFHFGGNTGDYTSRIIETAANKLAVYGEMTWTKPRQTLDNLGFDVNRQAKGHQQIGNGGIIIQWGSWSSPARGAGQWVSFDKVFPNGCMGVVVGVTNAASQMAGGKDFNNGGFIAATGNEDPLSRSGWYISIGW